MKVSPPRLTEYSTVRQKKIARKSVPHVLHDYFSSFNQLSLSLSLPLPQSQESLKGPLDSRTRTTTSTRFNKLTSVFHASVLLLIMNFVITLSK